MYVFLLILQDQNQSVGAELHRRRQLIDGLIIKIPGLFNDQRATCDLCNRRSDILLVQVCRKNLRHLYDLAATVLCNRFCKIHRQRRLSRTMCTKNQNITTL